MHGERFHATKRTGAAVLTKPPGPSLLREASGGAQRPREAAGTQGLCRGGGSARPGRHSGTRWGNEPGTRPVHDPARRRRAAFTAGKPRPTERRGNRGEGERGEPEPGEATGDQWGQLREAAGGIAAPGELRALGSASGSASLPLGPRSSENRRVQASGRRSCGAASEQREQGNPRLLL